MKTTVLLLFIVFLVHVATKTDAQLTESKFNPKTTALKYESARSQDSYGSSSNPGSQIAEVRLNGVEDMIYIGSDWPLGTIVLRNGGVIDNYFLRYNLLTDQMQFIAGNDTLAFASPQELNTLSFEGHTFVYENYTNERGERQGYFELIIPGKNKLLLKRVVTYAIPENESTTDDSSTKYLVDECYYISLAGKPASKILCNRKNALTLLNGHTEEIEEYLRFTGNKVKNIDDLKKLVTYYNALDEHE